MNLQFNTIKPSNSNRIDLAINTLNVHDLSTTKETISDYTSFLHNLNKNANDLSNRVLIIVPGYSVNTPPRIGDHRFYITALKYHPTKNPGGYKRIYLFDLYSKKDGRCHFKHDIPKLAEELYESLSTNKEGWEFPKEAEIDFIGASMGGLIVRQLVKTHLVGNNLLSSKKWGSLKIVNVVLIGTPNFGCKIVDKLQSPWIRFLLRLVYGRNHFAQSDQVKQIAAGNTPIHGRLLGKLLRRTTSENKFLKSLNSSIAAPGIIRWITIRGTRSKWFSSFIYPRNEANDGVIQASSVPLKGAENIADSDFEMGLSWNHRDLYANENVCKLLFGLLALNLKLDDYLTVKQMLDAKVSILQSASKNSSILQNLIFEIEGSLK